jgi:hypothetical protein
MIKAHFILKIGLRQAEAK